MTEAPTDRLPNVRWLPDCSPTGYAVAVLVTRDDDSPTGWSMPHPTDGPAASRIAVGECDLYPTRESALRASRERWRTQ